jgi:hypothetical protein
MKELVNENLPIEKHSIPVEEAIWVILFRMTMCRCRQKQLHLHC